MSTQPDQDLTAEQLDEHVRRLVQIRRSDPTELTDADLEAMSLVHRDGCVRMAAGELLEARGNRDARLVLAAQQAQLKLEQLQVAWQRQSLTLEELQRRVGIDAPVASDTSTIAKMSRELDLTHARIAELEQQAKAADQFDALLRFLGWRCQATTTRASLFTSDDHRAIWCTLPRGHAGMHGGEIENDEPNGVEKPTKTAQSQVHWWDPAIGQSEVSDHA